MQRILKDCPDISSYLDSFPGILDSTDRTCPHCGGEDTLIGHGTYRRWFITFGFKERIRIQRLRCKCCGVTIRLVPGFLRTRSPYSTEVVVLVRARRARGTPLYTLRGNLLNMGVTVKYGTIRSWTARAA